MRDNGNEGIPTRQILLITPDTTTRISAHTVAYQTTSNLNVTKYLSLSSQPNTPFVHQLFPRFESWEQKLLILGLLFSLSNAKYRISKQGITESFTVTFRLRFRATNSRLCSSDKERTRKTVNFPLPTSKGHIKGRDKVWRQ